MIHRQVMWGEVRVDCYGGPECDQHERYFEVAALGDKDSDRTRESLTLDPNKLPPGTRVSVMFPVCPKCDQDAESCDCGFDWKQWAEEQYA